MAAQQEIQIDKLGFMCGPVYHANYRATCDIVVNQGGTDSGKTYAIMQLLFTIATQTEAPDVDPIITVLSESVPNLKKGAYRVAKSIYNTYGYLKDFVTDWNESDRLITFSTGWQIEFVGATDEQNAKQGKRQYLFVNEANGIPWLIFWQMAKRTRKRTFIDYNPTAPFWAHDNLIGTSPTSNDLGATVQLIISDHRHNPFLTDKEHERTENIRDKELHRVYARGLTGNLSGLIFPSWTRIPDDKFPWQAEKYFAGIDFGYTNDPTGIAHMVRVADSIYIHELGYETGIPPVQINQTLIPMGYGQEETKPVYCEHDGDMIRQLRTLGLYAVPARKGPGSIRAGILKMSEYKIFYTASSKNIDFERKRYMWMKDPDTGKALNEPEDQYNHLMDAIRYGIYTHYYRAA